MKMRDNNPNNNMETFYEENAQFCATTTASSNHHNSNNNNNNNSMKRPLTLDLNAKPPKRLRLNASLTSAPVLSSPDLNMLKMESPELEKFLINNGTLQTPTPSSLVFPTKVTTEQEDYAKGFEEALSHLRNSENIQQNSNSQPQNPIIVNSMSGGSITYTNLDDSLVVIKDEPQTVPNSPPLSPIDLENQELLKLERKRQRNRVAASKCRKRKLERISKLEDKVKHLKGENVELGNMLLCLKEHVAKLKKQVMDHYNSGCTVKLTGL